MWDYRTSFYEKYWKCECSKFAALDLFLNIKLESDRKSKFPVAVSAVNITSISRAMAVDGRLSYIWASKGLQQSLKFEPF